jgi:hypothetical protein
METLGKRVRLLLLSSLGAVLLVAMSISVVKDAGAGVTSTPNRGLTRHSISPKLLRWQGWDITLHIVIAKAAQEGIKGCEIVSSAGGNLKIVKGARPVRVSKVEGSWTWVFFKCPTAETFVIPMNNALSYFSYPAEINFYIKSFMTPSTKYNPDP